MFGFYKGSRTNSDCELCQIHFPLHVNLTFLEILDLSSNHLDLGDRPILCNFQNNMSLIQYLDLSHNNGIGSVIPSCLYSFPSLEYLHLSHIKLLGVISSAIVNLTSLVSLDLSHNALAGKIPTSMGTLCNLEEIDLPFNTNSGKVSEVFESFLSGCLSNKLKLLHLDRNLFTGQIPDGLGEFKNLVELSLARNNISGPIPMSILQKLLSLKFLDIGHNNLNGSPPESVGSLSNLESLSRSYNQLSGSLPASLGSLSNLESLSLTYNQLSGSLPQSLGFLSNLKSMVFSLILYS